MAIVDPEFERHRQAWLGFAQLLRWAVAGIVIILVGLAIFTL
jgi:hypothetical protein